ncbi:hypothetical protein [Arthrobacter sp. ISL-30]|uniref:hypothetical protein n=1 Tax=Arthrobacter sp. ISL-30 TaxID=2819109 RepID=UPI001BE67457|nr:hypothetical protein [Arthrobacter sp. ISL-30]MBT2514654.1 hypothetical protein [Arthrobacter sp. ISL-30]
MTAPSLALLPSPLLGPAVWQPVADVLTDNGWQTVTCAAPTRLGTGQDVLDAFLAALPTDRNLVLVPHSNAGAYVPALMQHRPVVAAIFVDADLPPARGRVPLAPPAFLDLLRDKADGKGLLPMWSNWWDEAETAALFPDTDTRARVEREQHRLPLSYFEGSLPVPAGWDERPGAYLAFGDTYGRERDEAERRHWPVSTLPGQHLHLLNDPAQVSAKLVDLMSRLGISQSAG